MDLVDTRKDYGSDLIIETILSMFSEECKFPNNIACEQPQLLLTGKVFIEEELRLHAG